MSDIVELFIEFLFDVSLRQIPFMTISVDETGTRSSEAGRTNILRQPPSDTEITKFFLIIPLKYSQPYQPTGSQFPHWCRRDRAAQRTEGSR